MKFWTLENGTSFDKTYLRHTGYFFRDYDACKTHHFIEKEGMVNECRPAPIGYITKEADLKKPDGFPSKCNYTTFDDPTDATKQVNKTVIAR